MTEVLEAARDAWRRADWPTAHELFLSARAEGPLSADDLEALSDAAWWLGLTDEALTTAEDAYRAYLDAGRTRNAAVVAVDIAVTLFLRGDDVLGSGWIGRAQRLLRDDQDSAEYGYVRYIVDVEGGLQGSDADAVIDAARSVTDIGQRHGDANLAAGGVLGEGRALVRRGQVAEGMALLDEAMVSVLSDELSPEWAGNIYCHLMAACHELADIRRAREWTDATSRWLTTLPTAVLFTGICRVHRSQVLQVTGAWEQAEREATRVCEDLAGIHVASAAEGHYQVGEIRRLRGDLAGAEAAYQRARELGRDPQPGLALLYLARGRPDAASASIRAALLAVAHDRLARARLCSAQVEIALEAGDIDTAREACGELEATAAAYGTSGLEAAALHARGALLLADGRPGEALGALRAACRRWQELHAGHDAARVGLLLARAYRSLGDEDAAAAELDAAAAAFEQLGAAAGSRSVAELRGTRRLPGGLTRRESEVLALVAAGKTNREVAAALVLSEKTVARHLSNIFTKIDVSSRTQASAFAFEHGLATPSRG